MSDARTDEPIINSIIRAIRLLNLYGELEVSELGISDISKHLGLYKTSVFRIVKTLESERWLKKTESGKYQLGLGIMAVSSNVPRDNSYEDLILEQMKELSKTYNEDIVLSMLVGDQSVCIEKIRSHNNLRISSKVGFALRLDKGSTGKTLLAYLPQKEIDRYLDSHFDQSEQGVKARKNLEIELTDIRIKGYCSTVSEQDEGVASMTVPLCDGGGKVIYSLGIVGAEGRMQEKGLMNMFESLQNVATSLQQQFNLID